MSENRTLQVADAAVISPPRARSFREIVGLWMRLSQMSEEFFAREMLYTNQANTFLGVFLLAVIGAIISTISVQVYGSANPGGVAESSLGLGFVAWLVGRFAGFYIFSGVVYLAARMLGGRAEFDQQAYLMSLFQVPLGIAMAVVSLIPVGGVLANLGIFVYGMILNVRAVKAAHVLTLRRALIAVLLPTVVGAVLLIAGSVLLILILAGLSVGG
jgi:hypothetical protein